MDNENNLWDRSVKAMKNEIQVRHYSKKALKSYSLLEELEWKTPHIVEVHEDDLKEGTPMFLCPMGLRKNIKMRLREVIRQWFFPAKELTFVADPNEYRRYHPEINRLPKRPNGQIYCSTCSSCSS